MGIFTVRSCSAASQALAELLSFSAIQVVLNNCMKIDWILVFIALFGQSCKQQTLFGGGRSQHAVSYMGVFNTLLRGGFGFCRNGCYPAESALTQEQVAGENFGLLSSEEEFFIIYVLYKILTAFTLKIDATSL